MIILLVTFIAGICTGAFVDHVFTDPVRRIVRKARADMQSRLGPDGKPLDPTNDYERHLYALKLKQSGASAKAIAEALNELGLSDVPPAKRAKYVADVLHSTIVGFRGNVC